MGVGGGNREVPFLVARLVAKVGELFAAGVPGPFGGVDRVEGGVRAGVVTDVVEDEKLRLGPEIRGVGDGGRIQVGLGLAGDVARVAAVVFLGDRVIDVADERQGRNRDERRTTNSCSRGTSSPSTSSRSGSSTRPKPRSTRSACVRYPLSSPCTSTFNRY